MGKTWPVSIGTVIYRGYNLETTFQSLSKLGIKYVDLDWIRPPSTGFKGEGYGVHINEENYTKACEIRRMMEDHGLESISFSGHMFLITEKDLDLFYRKMEFARNIGAQYIATVEGPKSEEQRFLNNLERIEKRAEELDIVVCLETGMPGDIIQNANDAQRILKKVNSPHLGLSYDFGNAYYANRGKVNFLDELSKALPLTKLLHFKDVKVEKGNGKLIISNCAPGQGVIDFEAICQFLTQRNETLPITIEITYFCESKNWGPFEIKDYTKPLEEVEVMIKEAVGFLERNLNLDKI